MDKDEFCQAVISYQDGMYRLALSICGKREEAEDAVGETVLRAWEKLHTKKKYACRCSSTWRP